MVKLGEQLQTQQAGERLSRTQRVATKQRGQRDQRRFETLRAKAERIKQEKLSNVSAEEYAKIYDTLDADVKPFFSTGEEVLQQKAENIATTKQTIAEKIAEIEQKRKEKKAYYEKREDEYKDRAKKYARKGDDKRAERYRDKAKEMDDRADEYDDEFKGQIRGLQEGLKKLNANQNVDYKSIWSYAKDVGNYEQDKERARNDARKDFDDAKRKGELDEQFKRLKLDKDKTSYYEFKKSITDYNKKVDVQNNLINYANKVGFDKLTPAQKLKINPDLAQWQWENPKEKLIFDGLNPVGVESGSLKQSISLDNYQKVTSPDYIYDQWQKKNPAPSPPKVYDFSSGGYKSVDLNPIKDIKPSKLPIKTLTAGKELSYDYGSQGTASFDMQGNMIPATQLINTQDYYKIKNKKQTPIRDVLGGVKTGYDWTKERVHFTGEITSPIKFGKLDYKTKPEMAVVLGLNYLGKKKQSIEEWVIGKENIDEFNENLQDKYESKYQYQFEQKYMRDLIYGQTDFTTASKEFGESAEAKALQSSFEKEYGTGYKQLQTDTKFWKGTAGGLGYIGLSAGQLGLKIVGNPLSTATTTGAVVTGTKALGFVPTAVNLGVSGGLFAYGSYKFVSPKSTYIERGGGLATAVISGATLGYAGYRYLKSPVIKRVAIAPPKATLKASGTIGKDIKTISDGVTSNKVVYQSQKLSQTSVAGSRTVVSTKGRVLANKFWKALDVPAKHRTFESNAIYRGIPSAQPKIKSFGFSPEPSGYQKAFVKLTDYGWSPAQAKATLRYTAPKIYESYLNKGFISVKGAKATAYFENLVKRPVVDLGGGIKTRGGADLKDITKVTRQLVKDQETGKIFAKYSSTRVSGFVDKSGKIKDWKQFEFTTGKTFAKSTNQKGFEYLGKDTSGLDVFKEKSLYKDLFSFSKQDTLKLKITKTKSSYNVDANYNPARKIEFSNTKLYNKIIDLDKGKNAWVKPANIKKTPFSYEDPTPFTFTKETKRSGDVVKQIMDKVDDINSFQPKAQSKYFGTGQYEQSVGGLSPKEVLQNQNLLKGDLGVQNIKTGAGIKDAILIKQLDFGSKLAVGNVAGLGSSFGLKSAPQLKSNLKVDNTLKDLLKENVLLKSNQAPALKTSPALKSSLKSILKIDLGVPLSNIPTYRLPTQPRIRQPTIPKPFIIPFPKAKAQKQGKIGNVKGFNEQAYLPDFTSRALGLDPETLTEAQANKKLKKLLTGLEVRRGIKVKF